jgi:hypothetical protein
MAIAALIWGYKENNTIRKKCLVLSAFFLGAACATKQSGFILLLFYPFIINEFKILSLLDKNFKLIFLSVIILLCTALPWNIYNEYLINSGLSSSNLEYLVDGIHFGRSFIERITHALSNYPGIFILVLLAIPGLFVKYNRIISLFGLIYFLVWVLFFNYDARNFYIAIPFLTFSIGLTIQNILITDNFRNMRSFIHIFKINSKYLYILCGLFIVISIFLFVNKSDKINLYLNARQDRKLLSLGYHKSDNIFIVNISKTDNNLIFITNDPGLQYLTKDMKDKIYYFNPIGDINLDLLTFNQIIRNYKDKNIYLYLDDRANSNFITAIKDRILLLFSGNGTIYLINNR